MSPARVLVTGATGFVGAHLTRRLVGAGSEVHVVQRPDSDTARLADVWPAIVAHTVDLRDVEQVAAVVEATRPDRVFHLAAATMHAGRAPDADEQIMTNLRGTVALMNACRDAAVEAFVNVGDAFEYGPGEGPVAETAPCHPSSLDGITKFAASLYGCSLAHSADLPVVTIRPFSIVGFADDPRRLVPRLIASTCTGSALALSDRRIVRDFVWVDDALDLLVLAADHATRLRGEIVNCGSGIATTLGELVAALEQVAGTAVAAEWGAFPVAPHDLRHPIADVDAAARLLGWRPTTPLAEMLRRLWSASRPGQPR